MNSKKILVIGVTASGKGRLAFELAGRIGAEIIVHESVNQFSGKISILILKLLADPDWYLVYGDGTALVFVKNVQKFQNIITKISLPKEQIFNQILVEANSKIQNGETPEFHASARFGASMNSPGRCLLCREGVRAV